MTAAPWSRLFVFDFDGTLADTAPDMVFALHEFQRARGEPLADFDSARAAVSGGARALLALAGVSFESSEFGAARDEFLERYEKTEHRRTTLFSGMPETLQALAAAGVGWAIVSNKPRRHLIPAAAAVGVFEPDDDRAEEGRAGGGFPAPVAIVAGDDCSRAKPFPDTLQHAAAVARLPEQACAYVGDDLRDAQAARAAGMPFIIAAWGYWPASTWSNAEFPAAAAATPSSLPALARILP